MVEDSNRKEELEHSKDPSSNKNDDGDTGSENVAINVDSLLPENNDKPNTQSAGSENEKQAENKSDSKSDQTPNNDKVGDDHEEHSFNFNEVLNNDLFDSIRSRKDQILRYGATAVGVILIIYGIVLISASVSKVADNVIFGEGASYAAFLILLGFLIIVAAFSQKILNRTFLKNINSELELAEGQTKEDTKKSEKPDGENDTKKVKDDNHNIVGEDKK